MDRACWHTCKTVMPLLSFVESAPSHSRYLQRRCSLSRSLSYDVSPCAIPHHINHRAAIEHPAGTIEPQTISTQKSIFRNIAGSPRLVANPFASIADNSVEIDPAYLPASRATRLRFPLTSAASFGSRNTPTPVRCRAIGSSSAPNSRSPSPTGCNWQVHPSHARSRYTHYSRIR